jgi:hypothetical protein
MNPDYYFANNTPGNCSTLLTWNDPNGGINDVLTLAAADWCMHGNGKKTGELMVVDNLPSEFLVQGASCARCLPMTTTFSGFAPQAGIADLTLHWSCCKGGSTALSQCDCPKDSAGCMKDSCVATP